MLILYSLLSLLLISALIILAIPFINNRTVILSKYFFTLSAFTLLFSGSFYLFFGQSKALEQWFNHGKNHYELLSEVNRLGGFEGMIVRIKQKLKTNPNDAMGWLILGKIYLAQQNQAAADEAFDRAHQLQPDNQ